MSMNPEIKKLWLEALRSGKYKQGKYLMTCKSEDPSDSSDLIERNL